MAEEALRENEIVEAQLADVRASRARILEAADRGRREIERNLHDGAPSSGSYRSRSSSSCGWPPHRDLPEDARARVAEGLDELRAGLAELRDLAHGLHPAVLTDHGLKAVLTLASRAAVPVELDIELNGERPPLAIESVAYFTVSEALTNVASTPRRPTVGPSVAATGCTSRSATTGSAGSTSDAARASRAYATASAPSAAPCRSPAGPTAGPSCGQAFPSSPRTADRCSSTLLRVRRPDRPDMHHARRKRWAGGASQVRGAVLRSAR
jgi:hypothetical protein